MLNKWMVTYRPSCGFFSEQLHPACSLRKAGYCPSSPKTASIHQLLIIKSEGHYILEKVMAVLEKGILPEVTSRFHLFETQRWTVLKNTVFEHLFEETYTLLKPSRSLPNQTMLYFKEKEKSKPTICIFHIKKIITHKYSVSKAALSSCCSTSDGQNLVPNAKTKPSGQPPSLEFSVYI